MECKSLESQCDRYKHELQASNEKILILSQDLQQANKQSAILRLYFFVLRLLVHFCL